MAYRWNKNWASRYTANVSGKKILVVNDFQLALKLSQNNSVTYLTDDKEDYYDFLEMVSPVNNVNFGMDDSVHLVDYKGDYTKEITGMKFDLIVGNPPYDRSLHLKILERLLPFGKEIVWISPVRWLQDPLAKYKKTSDLLKYKDTILTRLKEVEVVSAKALCDIFERTNTDPGKNKDAVFTIDLGIYHLSEDVNKDFDPKKLYKNEWFIERVVDGDLDSVANHYLDKDELDMNIPFVRFSDIHGPARKANWYEFLTKDQSVVFDKNAKKVGGLNFDTQEEAENFFNYMQTDFIKFLGITIKRDVNVPLSFIPYMNDYTRPWTDEDLFKLFNITEDEQRIIHDTVKEVAK